MTNRKKILAVVGSAGEASSNRRLVQYMAEAAAAYLDVAIFDSLETLPHFNPERSVNNTPVLIEDFRNGVAEADGILICTPEYIFSIPSGLKNAFEWCVATTVFSDKPVALITASAHGVRGHEELQLIAATVGAVFTAETLLLVQGVKGKVDEEGNIKDEALKGSLEKVMQALFRLIENKTAAPAS